MLDGGTTRSAADVSGRSPGEPGTRPAPGRGEGGQLDEPQIMLCGKDIHAPGGHQPVRVGRDKHPGEHHGTVADAVAITPPTSAPTGKSAARNQVSFNAASTWSRPSTPWPNSSTPTRGDHQRRAGADRRAQRRQERAEPHAGGFGSVWCGVPPQPKNAMAATTAAPDHRQTPVRQHLPAVGRGPYSPITVRPSVTSHSTPPMTSTCRRGPVPRSWAGTLKWDHQHGDCGQGQIDPEHVAPRVEHRDDGDAASGPSTLPSSWRRRRRRAPRPGSGRPTGRRPVPV